MLRFVLIRVAGMFLVILVVSALVFALGSLIPGDLTSVVVGQEGATGEEFARVRRQLGLDDPLYVQYIRWLGDAITGDFGTSPITGRDVATDLAQQAPISLELAGVTLLLSTIIGMPLGVVAAVHANRRMDAFIRGFMLVMFSVPVFVVGVLLLLVAVLYLPGLLVSSYIPWQQDPIGHVRGMILPVASITLPFAAMTMQMTRSAMLEVLTDPSLTTARAAGVQERRIQYMHALKNALPPIVTLLGFQFGVLLGGLIVVEEIFGLPGLGRGMLSAVSTRDYPLVTAITVLFATAFVVVNVIVDLLYPLLDPRQRAS